MPMKPIPEPHNMPSEIHSNPLCRILRKSRPIPRILPDLFSAGRYGRNSASLVMTRDPVSACISQSAQYSRLWWFVNIFLDKILGKCILLKIGGGLSNNKTARNVSLEAEDWEKLEGFASDHGQTISSAIRMILRQPQIYLDWVDAQIIK